jgi:tetratricopeptide (TPR) repeat protein
MYDIRPHLAILIVCIVVGVLLLAAVYFFRKRDEIFTSLCWFLLFLFPVINIIPLNSTSLMADRYAYFSLMGFALGMAALICKEDGRIVVTVTVMLLAFYSIIDIKRNSIWKNEVSLFTEMTMDTPGKLIGFRNLGLYYYRNGDIARAAFNLEAADSKPDCTVKYLMGDAFIFWKENLLDKAERTLLRIQSMDQGNPEPYLLLALISEQKGDPVAAKQYREKLQGLVGDISKVLEDRTVELCSLGEKYIAKRQYVNAEIYLWQALKINPGYIPALIDMGSLKAEEGDLVRAAQYLSKALTLDPMNASVHYNLATVYRMQGRFADAQQEMIKFREAEDASRKRGKTSGP